jgi:hypothetical protein
VRCPDRHGSAIARASSIGHRRGSTPGCGPGRGSRADARSDGSTAHSLDAEGGLGFGELDVGPPQRLGRPVGDVGAQHVAAFAVSRPFVPFGPGRPFQPQTGGDSGVCGEADRVTPGSARVAPEKASDLALGGTAVHRIACPFEPPGEAEQCGFAETSQRDRASRQWRGTWTRGCPAVYAGTAGAKRGRNGNVITEGPQRDELDEQAGFRAERHSAPRRRRGCLERVQEACPCRPG